MKPTRFTPRILAASIAALAVSGVAAPAQAAPEDKGRVEIYGFVQMDAIYDFNTMNPAWNATLRPSKIPIVCTGPTPDAGCGEDGETVFSVRQSRLGFNGFIPTELGELKTKFEFDMFGVGVNEGQTTIRLRHAYGELGQFLAGQTNSLFMDGDVFPNTIDYWGPTGMIFFRTVQGRWTFLNQGGMKAAVALEGPGAAIDAGRLEAELIEVGGVNSWNKYPDVTGQFRMGGDWGHAQVAGIVRWLGYDTPDQTVSGHETGWGINLSGAIRTVGKDKLLMQVVYGEGISNYFNDGGVDLAPSTPTGGAEALPILGALVYYDRYWSEKWSSSIGYSVTSQDNSAGQTANAYKEGQYASVNLLYYPARNVMVGGELLWGERENNNGATGDDSRFQFSAKYSF